jgi:hypothetical protein
MAMEKASEAEGGAGAGMGAGMGLMMPAMFACQYCRVKSYLMPDDFFRYALPHATAESQDLVYFPYWRFKGMLFFCGPSGLANRFVDVSHQAIVTPDSRSRSACAVRR